MRVAQICGATDGAMWMVDLCASLQAHGYDVVAVIGSDGGSTARALRTAGVPFVVLPDYQIPYTPHVDAIVTRFRVRRLRRLVNRGLRRSSVLRLAWFLHRRRIDISHGQVFQSIILARLAAWLARVPIRVSSVPGPYHLEVPKMRRLDLRTQWIDTMTIAGAGRTDELYAQAGVDPSRRRVIHYGADPNAFDPDRADGTAFRKELGLLPGQHLVGQVAYFYAPASDASQAPPGVGTRGVKGHADFLAAARIVLDQRRDVRFALVGSGFGPLGEAHRHAMIHLAQELGLGEVVAFVDHRRDVPDVLAALDVSVQCSLNENYGGTIESLLMRRPTIATRVGGMPEAVRHEETGLLVPPSDPQALAAAMLRLIDDPELGMRVGHAGRELMVAEFTTEGMCDAVRALYEELLHTKLPGRTRR